MNRTLAFLQNTIGRIRYFLATRRKKILTVCHLSRKHWRWAAFGILALMVLMVAGMMVVYAGIISLPVLLLLALIFLGLPMLAGLGVHFALKLLRVIPEWVNWFFFGAVFFVMILFGFAWNALAIIAVFLLFSGSFLGAGLYNVTGRWRGLSLTRRILTLFFLVTGAGMLSFGSWYLLFPGKEAGETTRWSMETTFLPELAVPADPSLSVPVDPSLVVPFRDDPELAVPVDPSLVGEYMVDSLTYGSGMDHRRPEYGEQVTLVTPTVDGSAYLDGWDGLPGKLRTAYWKIKPDSLPINGRVWFPRGEGAFPLVLMVHGNHLDRDFSDPGYAYLGRHFASHGMIAVSVDENFLNGTWSDMDKGLQTENDCRGWLLLKHLEQWRQWNDTDTAFFFGRVDMESIMLIGHSRGGEAVSIASAFNRLEYYPDNAAEQFDFGFGIRGIAAIAPVDGQYWPAGVATPVRDVNYFALHGSMDSDLRSFHGMRQMRRVQFSGGDYHFASGLYIHGANHGQFNRSWGRFDINYPNFLMLNRRAIIPAEQQEKVALVYLTAFLLESANPGAGYVPLFKDYRTAREWLPPLLFLNQFHESSSTILCDFEEDIDLTTGGAGTSGLESDGLTLWKEGRIPMKWDNQRNSGVFLGWNNEFDTIPGWYRINLDTSNLDYLAGAASLTFLVADANTDPGVRPEHDSVRAEGDSIATDSMGAEGGSIATDSMEAEGDTVAIDPHADEDDSLKTGADSLADEGDSLEAGADSLADEGDSLEASADSLADEGDSAEDEGEEQPLDFSIVLCDRNGGEFRTWLGDYQLIQPPIKPQVFKSRLFWKDPESEVILQYVEIPLDAFRDTSGMQIATETIRAIRFDFDSEGTGAVILDQIGFTKPPGILYRKQDYQPVKKEHDEPANTEHDETVSSK